MARLFEPLTLRGVTLPNRIGVAPMCMYSAVDGHATDWHLVHLGGRAVGGAGLIIQEATAVSADGRITPGDVGLYLDSHIAPLRRINDFIRQHGAVPAVQLAHAGRKASAYIPWEGSGHLPLEQGGWPIIGPTAQPFGAGLTRPPRAATEDDLRAVVEAFRAGAERALAAGFDVVEIHAAHGYLLHSFLSPLVNQRTDRYGGSFENRIRLLLEVAEAVRAVWPADKPLFVRLSASDWVEGGWTIEDSIALAVELKAVGVDLIDCSSGGAVPGVRIPTAPGYQVPFAQAIRQQVGLPTAAVGLITDPHQAEAILERGQADLVLLARELLRNPYWPHHAARALGVLTKPPVQYERGFA
jgi:2,4-dienoyl-CoA reductase-like NADH-dependent reductase (Old Yellow Enzyme family)